MNKNMKNSENQKLAALRLAEIRATDQEDFENCVNDLIKTASLNEGEASIVAEAIRAKYLPNVMRKAGFEVVEDDDLVLDEGLETANFANELNTDETDDMHDFEDEDLEDDEDELMDDVDNDMGEVEDEDIATFEIEVPADMVEAAQDAIQRALDDLLGGEDESDLDSMDEDIDDEEFNFEDEDLEDDDFEDEDLDDEDYDDEEFDFEDEDLEDEDSEDDDFEDEDSMEDSEEDMEDDSKPRMNKHSKEVVKMTKQAMANRTKREAILKRLASEEEKYPASTSGFKHNNEHAEMPGEVKFKSMKLDGENSMKADNFDYAEQYVPTKNSGSLNFPDMTKAKSFDGSGDGSLEYTVDWAKMDIPSEGEMFDTPLIPSEKYNDEIPHKATRSAQKHAVKCTTCGYEMEMTDAEMESDSTSCPGCDKEAEATTLNVKDPGSVVNISSADNAKVAQIETARIKTAFSCSSKLALAGVIEVGEVDAYAEQMLNDNLKADAMIRQTKLLLRSAQASTERVAAAAAEKMNVRTASTLGISTSPAISGNSITNNAALDIQAALKGTWSMPHLED
jgi:hypothetical protein